MADEMMLDLTNYKDRVGSRVAPGRYRVQVEDVESDKSSNGNPMVNIWFRIMGGEFDGQTIVDRLVITEKSLFRVVGFMQAIGLPTPKKRLKVNIQRFLGQVLDIDVDDGDPYNGRVKSEVRGYVRVPKAQREEPGDLDGEDGGDIPDDLPAEDDAPATATPAAAADDATEEKPSRKAKAEDDVIDDVDLESINL